MFSFAYSLTEFSEDSGTGQGPEEVQS